MSAKQEEPSPLEVFRRKQSEIREAEIELEQIRQKALDFFGRRVVEAIGEDRVLSLTETETASFVAVIRGLEFRSHDQTKTLDVSVKIGSNCSGERQKLLKSCGLKSTSRTLWKGKCSSVEFEMLLREFGDKVESSAMRDVNADQSGDSAGPGEAEAMDRQGPTAGEQIDVNLRSSDQADGNLKSAHDGAEEVHSAQNPTGTDKKASTSLRRLQPIRPHRKDEDGPEDQDKE